ncbi:MAG: N-acetylmuramoyl-L-alanine amidase [Roseburia sp.]|nr:N-acetylmuramoyl-L-alanine amidase [Ruminococcus sp.]MCM1156640.1 N-acetylmuramoyl-L-alanine amidase [Roseburia sp.]MCM1242481.1 N-acetylmuramoyl-L-alanine amidase [Roseburia sp.]
MEQEKRYQIAIKIMAALLLALSVNFVLQQRIVRTSSEQVVTGKSRPCVVIDAGHGGADPGKVGINGALEKDINLEIARKLQMFLEMSDVEVILTRDSDAGLYDENASNKKVQDMKRRVAIIEETRPVVTISIHQNSYHEEYVHGAQTFYYETSEQSKLLAEEIQRMLLNEIDPDNKRVAKSNDSYYLLKKTSSPIVIVECGFLSNSEEAQKLGSDQYQEKLAWAIHMGVMRYINSLR